MGFRRSKPAVPAPRALAALAAVVFTISLAAWTGNEKRVKVTVAEPVRQIHTFEPGGPYPPGMPGLQGDERAACQSAFSANAGVRCRFQKTGFEPVKLAAQFSDIDVETGLSNGLWLPRGYSRAERDHEEAHARISERVYRDLAERTARQVGAKFLGRRTRAFLMYEDYEKLAGDATSEAARKIAAEWTDVLTSEAGRVNDAFDALTDHGRKDIPIEQAIEQAFAKARR